MADEPELIVDIDPALPPQKRVRSSQHYLSLKAALWLAAASLLPLTLVVLTYFSLRSASLDLQRQSSVAIHTLWQQARTLAATAETLQKDVRQTQQAMAERERATALQNLQKELLAQIRPLVEGKTPEEVAASAEAMAVIQHAQTLAQDIAIFDPGSHQILLHRKSRQKGPLEQILPELAQAWSQENASPPLQQAGWHWARIKQSDLMMALQVPALTESVAVAESVQTVDDPSGVLAALNQQRALQDNSFWTFFAILVGFSLLFSGFGFYWLRRKLLSPLQTLCVAAKSITDGVDLVPFDLAAGSGALLGLVGSFERMAGSVNRLREMEAREQKKKEQLGNLVDLLAQATSGKWTARAEGMDEELNELGLGVNRLLDTVCSQNEALHRATSHLQDATLRLQFLAREQSKKLTTQPQETQASDSRALCDLLGSQLEDFFHLVVDLLQGLDRAMPDWDSALDAAPLQEQLEQVSSQTTILQERAIEVTEASDRVLDLCKDTDALSNNLASAAKSHPQAQLDTLADYARRISVTQHRLVKELSRGRERFIQFSAQWAQEFGQLSLRCAREQKQLHSIRLSRHSVETLQHNLLGRIESLQPGTRMLASSIEKLNRECQAQDQRFGGQRELLQGVAGAAETIHRLAEEIHQMLARVSGTHATIDVHPGLDDKRRALEKAVQEMIESARGAGIEPLARETQVILTRLQQLYEQALNRVTGPLDSSGDEASDLGSLKSVQGESSGA